MFKNLFSKKPKQKVKRSRGALTLIGVLLMTSAVVRLSTEAGQVWALDDRNPIAQMDKARTGLAPLMSKETQEELADLLKALQQREEAVKKRESDMRIREHTVKVAEDEIRRRLGELKEAEDSLRDTLAIASTAAEKDLASLTDVYANMKPKQAAPLFEKMDPSFAAGFLSRMPADAAAKIMAGLTPDRAYLISVQLAGRNANAPTE